MTDRMDGSAGDATLAGTGDAIGGRLFARPDDSVKAVMSSVASRAFSRLWLVVEGYESRAGVEMHIQVQGSRVLAQSVQQRSGAGGAVQKRGVRRRLESWQVAIQKLPSRALVYRITKF
jgi:hypothetical protein